MNSSRLPYVNNAKAVFVTLALNLLAVLLLTRGGVGVTEVMLDAVLTVIATTVINFLIVYPQLKRLRAAGQLPQHLPPSRLMQKLPQNPILLGVICVILFSVLMLALNWMILTFFGISQLALLPWLVYKLIFAAVLSIKIVDFIIYRYVQPDWAVAPLGIDGEPIDPATVRRPLPKVSLAKELFTGITTNVLLNLVIGTLLGGALLHADGSMTLLPTTVEGIGISGLIFGLIMGTLISRAVLKGVRQAIWAQGPDALTAASSNRWFTWLPTRTIPLMIITVLATMLFSMVALPTILRVFNKPFLNFLQFSVLITIYSTLLGRPIAYLLTKRAIQRDFVQRTLDHYPAHFAANTN